MAKKYIDSEKLIAEIEKRIIEHRKSLKKDITLISEAMLKGSLGAYESIEPLINSLQQVQPEFPTTDEEIEIFLATHPKVEVPPKYKTLDWLLKKQEQPEVDLEKEIDACWQNWLSPSNQKEVEGVLPKTEFATYARHFYGLGLKAKEENK